MSRQVKFVWAGISYTIPEDTAFSKILLPTGVVLEFNGFLESHPPQLAELKAATFAIAVPPMADLANIAEQLFAVLATELGYCPDHPSEHGNFCSVCGKPIHPPTPLAPKPQFPFQGTANPMEVSGLDVCPTCGEGLNHAHYEKCQNCGQALKWTCRSDSQQRKKWERENLKQPINWDKKNPI